MRLLQRADRILINMEQIYEAGHSNVIANDRCYSAVITAWARNGSANAVQRSFELLDRMEDNVKEDKPHGKPNAHCYNAVYMLLQKVLSRDRKRPKNAKRSYSG